MKPVIELLKAASFSMPQQNTRIDVRCDGKSIADAIDKWIFKRVFMTEF